MIEPDTLIVSGFSRKRTGVFVSIRKTGVFRVGRAGEAHRKPGANILWWLAEGVGIGSVIGGIGEEADGFVRQ
jgi:hypothetical protein